MTTTMMMIQKTWYHYQSRPIPQPSSVSAFPCQVDWDYVPTAAQTFVAVGAIANSLPWLAKALGVASHDDPISQTSIETVSHQLLVVGEGHLFDH
jgi:hypothetical protein